MAAVKGWPPRYLTNVSAVERSRGDGVEVADFIESFCRVTKQSFAAPAGEALVLRPWQRLLLECLYARRADGRFKARTALIGMPRKSGKSQLLSGMTLHHLMLGAPGSEVYAVAASRDQARIIFETSKQMLMLEPELANACNVFRDTIENKVTKSVFKVLASEAPQLEGLSPSLVAFDELHAQPNRELFDVLSLASAARIDPMLVAITTAGVKIDPSGSESLCYTMYQYGQRVASKEVKDDSFFMAWWQPKFENVDFRDPKIWAQANPGYGDLSDPEDFASAVLRTPENEFKTKRLNIWTSSKSAWLPDGVWARCESSHPVEPGTEIVIGFDGSFSNDSTAVIGCTTDSKHVFVIGLWERPANRNEDWQVPIHEVEAAILAAAQRFVVREVVCDPYRWARSMEVLAEALGDERVLEYPQSPQRMSPATQRFFDMTVSGDLSHDGHPGLSRHIGNATLKQDARGSRISKESRFSAKKIDAAVAAIMAVDRACWQPPEATTSEVGFYRD